MFSHNYTKKINHTPCIFEYVYLARPDSTIDKINVYNSRLKMGVMLAKKIKKELSSKELNDIDVVIPIPDTSRTSALPLSIELDKDHLIILDAGTGIRKCGQHFKKK